MMNRILVSQPTAHHRMMSSHSRRFSQSKYSTVEGFHLLHGHIFEVVRFFKTFLSHWQHCCWSKIKFRHSVCGKKQTMEREGRLVIKINNISDTKTNTPHSRNEKYQIFHVDHVNNFTAKTRHIQFFGVYRKQFHFELIQSNSTW